jgi:hypothetical protein
MTTNWSSVDEQKTSEMDPRIREMFLKTFAQMMGNNNQPSEAAPITTPHSIEEDDDDDNAPPKYKTSYSKAPWNPPKDFKKESYRRKAEKVNLYFD